MVESIDNYIYCLKKKNYTDELKNAYCYLSDILKNIIFLKILLFALNVTVSLAIISLAIMNENFCLLTFDNRCSITKKEFDIKSNRKINLLNAKIWDSMHNEYNRILELKEII